MRALLFLIALLPGPCLAQLTNPGNIDPVARSVASSACQPMASVPPTEVVGGTAGSGNACRLVNAVQPRISRSVGFTTASNGQAVVTWQDMGAVPKIYVQENVVSGANNIPKCYPITSTITSTGVTVACYITQSILGLGLLPFTTATAGVTGQVLALPAS